MTRGLLLFIPFFLSGCLAQVWTGASFFYDRHHFYKKMEDYQLAASANHWVFEDGFCKQQGCSIDMMVFNHDILFAGHVTTLPLQQEFRRRLAKISGYRHLYNHVLLAKPPTQTLSDAWITTTIRTAVLGDSTIDPNGFKVMTCDGIVYLMGAMQAAQAKRLIYIASETSGVRKVEVLLKYYTLTSPKNA